MGMLIRAISQYSAYIFENIGINKRKYREHISLKCINTKSMEDHPTLLLNTYFHFSLSSKNCALACLRSNVLGHEHVRQLRDTIEAHMKEERLILCDVRIPYVTTFWITGSQAGGLKIGPPLFCALQIAPRIPRYTNLQADLRAGWLNIALLLFWVV
jgi:hypothetical protein